MGGLALAMWAYSQESGAHTAFAMYGPPPRSPQLANFGGSPPPPRRIVARGAHDRRAPVLGWFYREKIHGGPYLTHRNSHKCTSNPQTWMEQGFEGGSLGGCLKVRGQTST